MRYRTVLLILAFTVAAAAPVAAGPQLDIGVNIPLAVGISVDGENAMEEIPFHIPIPDLMFNYFFIESPIKLGVGVRVWTIIVLTGGYPIATVEFETNRLLLNAHIGGGIFGYLSPIPEGSGIETGRVFLPEVSAAFRFTDWFSAGISVLGVMVPELTDGFGYTVNLLGRFRVR